MLKFENSSLSGVFLMPKDVEKHLASASGNELKVLIYIFSHGGICDEAQMAKELGIPSGDISSALAFWRGAGIISYGKSEEVQITIVSETKPSEKTVSYSQKEIADAINGNEDVRSLMNFASQTIGKILTPNEQGIILSLIDSMSMGCELVMGIIDYCCNTMDKKSVRYIERTAAKMHDEDGVDTYEKFEEYIARKSKEKTFENIVRSIIGAENRALTKTEREIIAGFAAANVSDELISVAYERTIGAIGKPSLSYMSKIIENWNTQGIKNKADLDGMKPFDENDAMGAFSLDDFTEKPDDLI